MFSRKILLPALLLSAACILPSASRAEYIDNSALMDRMDQMEQNIMLLQRQVSRGGAPIGGDAAAPMGGPATANAVVRQSEMEEELRKLQGQIEENSYQTRLLSEKLDKMSADVEYRLNALEHPGSAGAAPAAVPATPPSPQPQAGAPVTAAPAPSPQVTAPPQTYTEDKPGILKPPAPPQQDASGNMVFDNPRDHYNYAFKLLNQTKYDDAAKSFEQFTTKYPNDPLIGNAFYWLGETYYVRQDYIKSADYFRQGFEKAPSGPKAADNLLKLSMSLSAINRNKEACVVLNQLLVKFGNNSKTVKQKTEQEINRIGCQ